MLENSGHRDDIQGNQVSILEVFKQSIQNLSITCKYQKKLIFYFLLIAFFTTLPMMASSLYYMNPVFQCEESDGKTSQEDACRIIQSCVLKNNNTITAELDLFCGSGKEARILLQTAFGYGCWLGLAVVSLFGDRIGRKFCFTIGVLTLNITWLCQLIGVHLKSVSLLFLADLVNGFSGRLIYINFLVILTRFLNKDAYEMETIAFLIIYHGVTQMAIAGINQIFESWRAIVYLYSVGILLCSIAAFFVLKEDPIFLFDSGQMEKAKRVIEEIGQENNEDPIKIKENIDKLDIYGRRNVDSKNIFSLWELVRCDILLNAFLIALAGFFYVISVRSIELSIQSLDYSYNFNLFIVGFSNVCGLSTAMYIIKIQQQRKRGLIYTSLIYCLISLLFLFPFCTQNGIVESLVIFFMRFFTCWHLNFFTRLKVDTFSQKYQSTIMGAIDFIMSFGLIVSPHLVQHLIDHQLNAILVVGILRLTIGVVPMFLIREEKIQLNSDETSEGQKIESTNKNQQ